MMIMMMVMGKVVIIIIINIMFMMVIIVSIAYKIYQAMIMNIGHAGHVQYQLGAVSYKIADNDNDHHRRLFAARASEFPRCLWANARLRPLEGFYFSVFPLFLFSFLFTSCFKKLTTS